jgi:hypothetical protein
VSGGVHRHVAQRAQRATAGDRLGAPGRHRPHLGAGGVEAGDIPLVVLVVAVVARRLADRGVLLFLVSGSKPSPMSRARKSGTVGSRRSAALGGSVIGASGYWSAMRSRKATASVARSATCSFSTSTVSRPESPRAWM